MGRGRTRDIICHEEETNMKIRAEMGRRHAPLWPHEYQVDKVVELPNVAFASFMIQPLDSYDFIRDNRVEPHQGTGLNHCLLLLGDDRTDGALVQCGDDGRAMYAAYVAGARDVVQARLDRVADFIVSQGAQRTASGSWCVYCEELEEKFGVTIREGSGLDAMLIKTLERRPEVAQVDISLQHIETTFRLEFCAQHQTAEAEKAPDIRVRDILPLLNGSGLAFLTHEEAGTSVLAENLRELTGVGREDYAALFNARVSEISPGPEGVEVVLIDVDPQELARFNQAYEDHQAAEWAMGDMTP
jgi:hypothetical protein